MLRDLESRALHFTSGLSLVPKAKFLQDGEIAVAVTFEMSFINLEHVFPLFQIKKELAGLCIAEGYYLALL